MCCNVVNQKGFEVSLVIRSKLEVVLHFHNDSPFTNSFLRKYLRVEYSRIVTELFSLFRTYKTCILITAIANPAYTSFCMVNVKFFSLLFLKIFNIFGICNQSQFFTLNIEYYFGWNILNFLNKITFEYSSLLLMSSIFFLGSIAAHWLEPAQYRK